MSCSLPRGQVAATLFDVTGDGTAGTVITLGLLDLRFRDSLAALSKVFDEIYVDTPPAVNFFTRSALIAAP